MRSPRRLVLAVLPILSLVMLLVVTHPSAQTRAGGAPAQMQASAAAASLTTPEQEWGHKIGDDYFLADYQQLMAYWNKLAKQSNRLHVVDIGKSSEGRPMYMAVITSPANYAKLDTYRSIAKQLATNEDASGRPLTEGAARQLAQNGKAVVWIDG